MGALRLGARQVSMVWLEPRRVHAGGRTRGFSGPPDPEALVPALEALPPGPTRWVVDDAWIPSLLLRDIVELPAGAEAREAFFKWRFRQSLALEAPQAVQALSLGDNAWLLSGLDEALRETWLQASYAAGRPIRSLIPRWLWLYNRLAPSREEPGLLLSLGPDGEGGFSGTLAAWGTHLLLLRQWTEPAAPETWVQDRVLPTAAYLQRESRHPQELLVWGAQAWPEGPVPARLLAQDLPSRESL